MLIGLKPSAFRPECFWEIGFARPSDADAEKVYIERCSELLAPIEEFQKFAIGFDCLVRRELGYWEVGNSDETSAKEYFEVDFDLVVVGWPPFTRAIGTTTKCIDGVSWTTEATCMWLEVS